MDIASNIAAMQHNSSATAHSDADVARVRILEAAARGVLLTARYNGQALTLSPHALFARRGELYVSALNLSKNWRDDDERRLGYFKVAGLATVEVTEQPVDALSNAGPVLPKTGDEILLAIA